MADAADLGFAVKLPPRRAIAYFKAKGYTVSWNWWDAWGETHAKAFTAAKAVKLDVLQSLRGGLDRALTQGLTERTFIKEMEPALRRLGWWGRQFVVNARGEAESVQLGSPHRLKTIFRTNMNTSYAAARERQQRDDVENRPYWQYLSMADGLTRPSHAALNGQVFRHDDPVWDSHYPPNGFNCRCRVRALTAKQVKDRGLKVQTGKGRLSTVQQEAGVDKQTGEVITRPGTAYRGVGPGGNPFTLTPDPGFSYNPGREMALFDAGAGPPVLRDLVVTGQKSWRDFALPEKLPTLPAPARLPPAATTAEAMRQMNRLLGNTPGFEPIAVARADGKRDVILNRVRTPEGLEDVHITESFVRHIIEDHPGEHRERFARYILPTLRDPAEVWLTAVERGGRTLYRRRFIAAFKGDDSAIAVAQEGKDGSLAWTFYPVDRTSYLNDRRRGFLLYRKPVED